MSSVMVYIEIDMLYINRYTDIDIYLYIEEEKWNLINSAGDPELYGPY